MDFQALTFASPGISFVDQWPSRENPDAAYKFVSLWFELSQSLITTERKTYSILEWIGDVGGLFDGLMIIASNLITPFATLTLQFALFTSAKTTDAKSNNTSTLRSFFCLQSVFGLCCNRLKSKR